LDLGRTSGRFEGIRGTCGGIANARAMKCRKPAKERRIDICEMEGCIYIARTAQ
jgi:hypothetical protein